MWNRPTHFITYVIRLALMWVGLFLRFTLPLLVQGAWFGLRLIGYAAFMWFVNLWTAIGQLALLVQKEQVARNPHRNPGDSRLEPFFLVLYYIEVIVELVVGWVLAAHLTVWLTTWLIALIF